MLSRLVGLVAVVLVVGACQADLDVSVVVAEDGSGEVTVTLVLDEEASQRIPDLGAQLQVADLEQSNWQLEGPATADDGTVTIVLRRPFSTIEEANGVLRGLTLEEGPFKTFELDRSRTFARTSYSFSGQIDVTSGCVDYPEEPGCALASFAESELSELLGGQPFGGQLLQIANDTGDSPEDEVTLDLAVLLPGAESTWTVDWDMTEPEELQANTSQWRQETLVLAGSALFFFVIGLISFLVRAGRADADRQPRTIGSEDADYFDDDEADDAWDAEEGAGQGGQALPGVTPPEAPADRSLQLLVLDAMSMLFSGDEPGAHLASFVRDKGSDIDPGEVVTLYERARVGEVSIGELWGQLGLVEDPGTLSDEYLTTFRLRPGVRDFLERMRARGLPVACVANDIGEWSRRLRSTHKLEHLTAAWITASDVHEALPGGAVLDRVTHTTGIAALNSFFLSANLSHLDAARDRGFAAAQLVVDDGTVAGDYPVIASLDDLGLGD